MSAPPHDPTDLRPHSDAGFLRSMTLSAFGVALGLIFAGYALFTARGTWTLAVPPEDVALVNQQPIARVDYIQQLRATFNVGPAEASDAQRRKVLDDMIREELFVQRGTELDVAAIDPPVRAAMVAAVEGEVAADAVSSAPLDRVILAYYNEHRGNYASEGTMTVRDLVFGPVTASAAAAALANGEPADSVLKRFAGHDSGKVSGEEFYFAAQAHLGPRLFAVARGLADGRSSAPVVTADGAHVLVMIANAPPVAQPFAQVRFRVRGDYQAAAVARLEAGDLSFLRKRANILIAPDVR